MRPWVYFVLMLLLNALWPNFWWLTQISFSISVKNNWKRNWKESNIFLQQTLNCYGNVVKTVEINEAISKYRYFPQQIPIWSKVLREKLYSTWSKFAVARWTTLLWNPKQPGIICLHCKGKQLFSKCVMTRIDLLVSESNIQQLLKTDIISYSVPLALVYRLIFAIMLLLKKSMFCPWQNLLNRIGSSLWWIQTLKV